VTVAFSRVKQSRRILPRVRLIIVLELTNSTFQFLNFMPYCHGQKSEKTQWLQNTRSQKKVPLGLSSESLK